MLIAVIVISALVAVGLITFFTCYFVNRKRNGTLGKPSWAGVKAWFVNHRPSKRRLIQVYAMLLYNANLKGYISGEIYKGNSKTMCVPGLNCYSCPGAVGACPLGALQNALAASETRAPYYMLGILALFGLICARTICGFLCPVGLCQELLYKIRTPKLKKSRVTRVLSYFKYVLLALAIALPIIYTAVAKLPLPPFCKYICPAGTFEGAVLLLINPNNDGYFVQLGGLFTWKFTLLIVFVVASMFIFRVFCRFICPLGAIYGCFNKFALIGVTVDKSECTNCGLCVSHCKMDVKRVGDHECINCGECMAVCPTKAITWKGSRIFLKGNAIDEKPIAVSPIAVGADGSVTLGGDTAAEIPKRDESAAAIPERTVHEEDIPTTVEKSRAADGKPATERSPRKKRGARYWAEFAAWCAAAAVLIAALVFYNFVDVAKPVQDTPDNPDNPGTPDTPSIVTGYNVGDVAPDFTVSIYGTDGEFNLYENRGKTIVLNFWGTWCSPCVKELPYFNELAYLHPELTVVAMHGSSNDDVMAFIQSRQWTEYPTLFTQDNLDGRNCLTFKMFGGRDAWPMTVIIGADGKVLYNSIKSFSDYDALEKTVLDVIGDAD